MQMAILKDLLNPATLELVKNLWQYIENLRTPRGMYEVLEYDNCLELVDTKGKSAIHYTHKKVRFTQDNVFAIQDHMWGDGDIFADYRCSPGVVADYYREGQGYRVLISLRETKKKGDIEEFFIERRIKNGFTAKEECFQSKVNHPMEKLSITIVFPRNHPSIYSAISTQRPDERVPLEAQNICFLPDGRQQISWSITKPKLNEIYTLHWKW